jgi:molecular chaperone GrpE
MTNDKENSDLLEKDETPLQEASFSGAGGSGKVDEEAAASTEGAEEDLEQNGFAALEADVLKWRELAMRTQADLENYRKRMAREKVEAIQYANASLLHGLLPILDNFDMGLEAARAENASSVIFQGMSMVKKQIEDFLAEEGVKPIEPATGEPFDPNRHEAVQQERSDEVAENRVISVLRRGFRLHDRLLRAANVVVSRGPEQEGAGEDNAKKAG